jgi:D-alanine-D-alanine ligase
MPQKIRVGVIFGGRSGEHEVSVRSARSVIEALDPLKFTVVPLAITKEGRWLSPAEAARLLPESARERLNADVASADERLTILADPSRKGLVAFERNGRGDDSEHMRAVDVVFPVLHGTYGEDGTIQGLLEMAGLPYVGCGVLASSTGMDKVAMKSLFRDAGLPMCNYVWFLRSEWERDARAVERRVARGVGFPCFVKPANLGSSVGISRADDAHALGEAIRLAARYDRKIIVEEGLDAREIECAVLGNDDPEASLPGEYVIRQKGSEFLDYTEKYSNTGHVEFVVPAALPKRASDRIRRMAVTAFKALDGAGLARVDFFLRRDNGELLINELNTIPGLTDVSGYPKLWAATGLPFDQVLERLIALSIERFRDKSRNETSI